MITITTTKPCKLTAYKDSDDLNVCVEQCDIDSPDVILFRIEYPSRDGILTHIVDKRDYMDGRLQYAKRDAQTIYNALNDMYLRGFKDAVRGIVTKEPCNIKFYEQ